MAGWLIRPRDPDLQRTADPVSDWSELILVERHNTPDTWTVTAPTRQMEAAFVPGSGSILTHPDRDQPISGQATAVEWDQAADKMTVAFASDLIRPAWRIAYPTPGHPLTAAISKFPASHDTRTGPIEDLIVGYLRSNLGDLAQPNRRQPRLRIPASQGRGGTTTVSARLDNLGTLVQTLAEAGNLSVRIVHTEDADGPWLDVVIDQIRDLSADVRFGTPGSTATGLIRDAKYSLLLPTTTRAVVAGGGDLADREFIQLINASAETLWAAAVEAVVDQRNIDPASLDKLTELTREGNEALAAGAEPRRVSFETVLGPDLTYPGTVRVGDVVAYKLPGLDPATDKVREATTTVTRRDGAATEKVRIVVGTPDAPASRAEQQNNRQLRDINVIRRSL